MERPDTPRQISAPISKAQLIKASIVSLLLTIPGWSTDISGNTQSEKIDKSLYETIDDTPERPFAAYQATFQEFVDQATPADKWFIDQGKPVGKVRFFSTPLTQTPPELAGVSCDQLAKITQLPKVAEIELDDQHRFHALVDDRGRKGTVYFFADHASSWQLVGEESYTGQLDDKHSSSCKQVVYDYLRKQALACGHVSQITEGAFPYLINYETFLNAKAGAYIDTEDGCTQIGDLLDVDHRYPPERQRVAQNHRAAIAEQYHIDPTEIMLTNDYLTPRQIYQDNFNQPISTPDGEQAVGYWVGKQIDQRELPAASKQMIKGLVFLESGYAPDAHSPAGAKGLFQWMSHYQRVMHQRYTQAVNNQFPDRQDRSRFNPHYQTQVAQWDFEDIISLLTTDDYHPNSKVDDDYSLPTSPHSETYQIVADHLVDEHIPSRTKRPLVYRACHYLLKDLTDCYPTLDMTRLANATLAVSHVYGIYGTLEILRDLVDASQDEAYRTQLIEQLSSGRDDQLDTDEFMTHIFHSCWKQGTYHRFGRRSASYYEHALAFADLAEQFTKDYEQRDRASLEPVHTPTHDDKTDVLTPIRAR